MGERPIVLVSNRGPVSFRFDPDQPGEVVARKGAGGLVSGLGPEVADTDALWVAAAMTDADRSLATKVGTPGRIHEAAGFRVALLDIDPADYDAAYDTIGNSTLWFVHHGMLDWIPDLTPEQFDDAWSGFQRYNDHFAEVVADLAPADAVVLIQDYHLSLLATRLRDRRPDLRLVHFSHTPFARPEELEALPPAARTELLAGLEAHDRCGFHTARWAEHFEACRAEHGTGLGPRADVFVSPLSPAAEDIEATADSAACEAAFGELVEATERLQVIVRVDRMEPTKNVLGGFDAYERLLERQPHRHGAVTFVSLVYPSREGIEAYRRHRHQIEAVVSRINERFGTDRWLPIRFESRDDFPRSVAALRHYDVLLVNPHRDGMNLVAKEGPIVNERDGAVCLSTEAGAYPELAGPVIEVDPTDVDGTARALARALDLGPADRRSRAEDLRRRAVARTPADWLAEQRHGLGRA